MKELLDLLGCHSSSTTNKEDNSTEFVIADNCLDRSQLSAIVAHASCVGLYVSRAGLLTIITNE